MYLVDTNVLSEATKPVPDVLTMEWLETNEALVRLSTITIGELRYGIELLAPGRKQTELRHWFDQIRGKYAHSILSVDDPVAQRWGLLRARLDHQGRKMPMTDSLLAATALEHDLTMVTANTDDFAASGVKLLNPAVKHQ